jgi:hypothetical protein
MKYPQRALRCIEPGGDGIAVAVRTDAIDQNLQFDAASRGPFQCFQQPVTDDTELEDVNLEHDRGLSVIDIRDQALKVLLWGEK